MISINAIFLAEWQVIGVKPLLYHSILDLVSKFEKEFLAFITRSHPQVKAAIKDTGEISSDEAEEIKRLCQEFLKDFT